VTQASKQMREWIEANYPDSPIGRKACRDTSRGGISQHSAFDDGYDSNALDVFGPGKTSGTADQAYIQAIVDTIRADGESKWSIRKIIWRDGGAHENHCHIDFYPMITVHKWCGGSVTPNWRFSNGTYTTTRDPSPQNGAYNGDGSDPIPPPLVPDQPPSDEEAEMKEYIEAQQKNLNNAGFRDYEGKVLAVDGVYGKRTQSAEAKRDSAAAVVAPPSGPSPAHTHPFSGLTGVQT